MAGWSQWRMASRYLARACAKRCSANSTLPSLNSSRAVSCSASETPLAQGLASSLVGDAGAAGAGDAAPGGAGGGGDDGRGAGAGGAAPVGAEGAGDERGGGDGEDEGGAGGGE